MSQVPARYRKLLSNPKIDKSRLSGRLKAYDAILEAEKGAKPAPVKPVAKPAPVKPVAKVPVKPFKFKKK